MKIEVLILTRADGQYVAHCTSLPGCTARANTRESAEHKMRDAVAGYLASLDVPLKGSGMRWDRPHAEGIIALSPRTIIADAQEMGRE